MKKVFVTFLKELKVSKLSQYSLSCLCSLCRLACDMEKPPFGSPLGGKGK